MNTSFKLRVLVCCALLAAFATVTQAEDKNAFIGKDQNKAKAVATEIKEADAQPLIPVPEPSAMSLILIGVACTGLALKMRSRA